MNAPTKLTDLQLAILFAASKREDRCLVAPNNLRGGAAQRLALKLLTGGLVREIKAKGAAAVWRRDEEAGQAWSLKLTAAGLKAVTVDQDRSEPAAAAGAPTDPNRASSKARRAAAASASDAPMATPARQSTKLARVITLLGRDQGARLDELVAATGWLPHSARAALTGLRHKGYDVRLERGESGRASVYRAQATLATTS